MSCELVVARGALESPRLLPALHLVRTALQDPEGPRVVIVAVERSAAEWAALLRRSGANALRLSTSRRLLVVDPREAWWGRGEIAWSEAVTVETTTDSAIEASEAEPTGARSAGGTGSPAPGALSGIGSPTHPAASWLEALLPLAEGLGERSANEGSAPLPASGPARAPVPGPSRLLLVVDSLSSLALEVPPSRWSSFLSGLLSAASSLPVPTSLVVSANEDVHGASPWLAGLAAQAETLLTLQQGLPGPVSGMQLVPFEAVFRDVPPGGAPAQDLLKDALAGAGGVSGSPSTVGVLEGVWRVAETGVAEGADPRG